MVSLLCPHPCCRNGFNGASDVKPSKSQGGGLMPILVSGSSLTVDVVPEANSEAVGGAAHRGVAACSPA